MTTWSELGVEYAAIGRWAAGWADQGVVVSCSALNRVYRDRLRAHAPEIVLLHLTGDRELITERQVVRKGHFMPRSLIDSQFATPGPDERVVTVDVAPDEEPVVATAVDLLRAQG
ncbi:hypothetical protein ACIOHH_35020 [Streptomyces microflavus]|uniref:hypothetical protein n=1 Tax=Streptomyces microflavus TaxID=1919 RepID=UPI0037F583E1